MDKKANQTSQIIADIIAECGEDGNITVDAFLKKKGHRAQSMAILVFAISAAVAGIVPGFSTITGIPILFIAFQMVIGGRSVGLPRSIRQKEISPRIVSGALTKSIPMLARLERLLRPRLLWLTHPIAQRLIALFIMVMATVLLLPIPGGNFIPSITIVLLSLAILERDGLLVIAVCGMVALTAGFMLELITKAYAMLLDLVHYFS